MFKRMQPKIWMKVGVLLFVGIFLFTQAGYCLHYTRDHSLDSFFKSDFGDALSTAAMVIISTYVANYYGGPAGAIRSGVVSVGSDVAIACGADPRTTMIIAGGLNGALGSGLAGAGTGSIALNAIKGAALGELGYELQKKKVNPFLGMGITTVAGLGFDAVTNTALSAAGSEYGWSGRGFIDKGIINEGTAAQNHFNQATSELPKPTPGQVEGAPPAQTNPPAPASEPGAAPPTADSTTPIVPTGTQTAPSAWTQIPIMGSLLGSTYNSVSGLLSGGPTSTPPPSQAVAGIPPAPVVAASQSGTGADISQGAASGFKQMELAQMAQAPAPANDNNAEVKNTLAANYNAIKELSKTNPELAKSLRADLVAMEAAAAEMRIEGIPQAGVGMLGKGKAGDLVYNSIKTDTALHTVASPFNYVFKSIQAQGPGYIADMAVRAALYEAAGGGKKKKNSAGVQFLTTLAGGMVSPMVNNIEPLGVFWSGGQVTNKDVPINPWGTKDYWTPTLKTAENNILKDFLRSGLEASVEAAVSKATEGKATTPLGGLGISAATFLGGSALSSILRQSFGDQPKDKPETLWETVKLGFAKDLDAVGRQIYPSLDGVSMHRSGIEYAQYTSRMLRFQGLGSIQALEAARVAGPTVIGQMQMGGLRNALTDIGVNTFSEATFESFTNIVLPQNSVGRYGLKTVGYQPGLFIRTGKGPNDWRPTDWVSGRWDKDLGKPGFTPAKQAALPTY